MPKAFFELERIDGDALRRVGGLLRAAGYTEEGVRDRLGLDDIGQIRLEAYPHYVGHRLRRRDPLDLAILLFLLQGVVAVEELDALLDADARRVLRDAGVLLGDRASRTYRSRVSLYPLEDKLFFTDHRFAHHPWLEARVPREPVMYLGADTYFLARTTIRRPVRAALDLCTGAGVHAILAAGSVERAVGVDINRRAVNFARLNAMLNDAWNAVFLEGDLFSPVGGERFDLVLANPPFVPSPVYELAYRDGGPSGADVLRRIVSSLPDFLSSDGVAHVVTHVAEREGEPYLERVRRWLGGANFHLHSLRLGEDDIVDYAIAQTKRVFGERYARYAGRLTEWATNLRAQRFRRVVGVVLSFQWNAESPSPPWTQEDEVQTPPRGNIASELARLLAAKRRVREMRDLAALDAYRVGVPDDLQLTELRRPTGRGFQTQGYRVTLRHAAFSPELEIKPLVRDLLERIDNRSTVPQVIERLAADLGKSPADIGERCRRALLVMFERGLVTFDEVEGPSAERAELAAKSEPAPAEEDPFEHSGEAEGAPEPASSGEGASQGPGATIVQRSGDDPG